MDQLKLTTELEDAIRAHDVAAAMRAKNISMRSMVALMQTRFPRFDKSLLSKCKKPDDYGVVLHPDGFRILGEFPDRKAENRTLKKRIYARLTEDEYNELLHWMTIEGFDSVQDLIRSMVQEYIDRKE